MSFEFGAWRDRWTELARYSGAELPDEDARSDRLLDLWRGAVPRGWERPAVHPELLGRTRYRRGDVAGPSSPERLIEWQLLHAPLRGLSWFDQDVVDGINAVPLSMRPKVEADAFLLVAGGAGLELAVAEVKHAADHAWYAVVENLRELRLVIGSDVNQRVFHERCRELSLPTRLPVYGVVLAPRTFYTGAGRRERSVGAACRLIALTRRSVSTFGWRSGCRSGGPRCPSDDEVTLVAARLG